MEKIISKEISCLHNLVRDYISKDTDFYNMFNMTQFHVMMYLIDHMDEDVCQKDLELETNLKKASITGVIDTLAKKGFVERVAAEDDRRKNYVRLTQKTLDLRNSILSNVDEVNKLMTCDISKDELDGFFEVIAKIRKNVEARMV